MTQKTSRFPVLIVEDATAIVSIIFATIAGSKTIVVGSRINVTSIMIVIVTASIVATTIVIVMICGAIVVLVIPTAAKIRRKYIH